MSSACICMFRLCNNNVATTTTTLCPVHSRPPPPTNLQDTNEKGGGGGDGGTLVQKILYNFSNKNIQYISTLDCYRILHSSDINMLIPLVIHVHQDTKTKKFHLASRKTHSKLNNVCVSFTNLFIINIIQCKNGNRYCSNNKLLDPSKIITFKYLIVINCIENRPQRYLQRCPHTGYFKCHLGAWLLTAAS